MLACDRCKGIIESSKPKLILKRLIIPIREISLCNSCAELFDDFLVGHSIPEDINRSSVNYVK